MKKHHHPRTLAIHAAIALCLAFMSAAPADESSRFTGWKSASTNHFRFIFEEASRSQAEAFAAVADGAWNGISGIYGTPPDMTDVLVTARTDTVNAFAEGLSYYMGFYTNPPLSPDFGYREEWHKVFFTHELVHIANFSFEGKSHAAADIFGPAMNLFNFIGIPGWYQEGLTTVLETELTTGGRGRSPFFELYYKSLVLENAFLDYGEIGEESEAPQGQIYVMGYILMRSIADRFGIDALATIERNRTGGRKFDESVKLVTGMTCEEIFRDARIALTKKYALERSIPEGKTVSPRENDTYYFRPALVDGKGFLTLRDRGGKDMAAVRYDPSSAEETVLFGGNFHDEYSLAAGENGTVVASLRMDRYDSAPGYTAETDLYTWTEKTGLVRLTSGTSLFQPALSRSGNRLVAVEMAGTQYRLVEVDLSTGARKTLFESPNESFIQPALSADGSRVAFLALDGKKAVLATALMPTYDFAYPIPAGNVSRTVNQEGPIIDIANPSWTKDGSLLFASNERGRLEVWELKDGKRTPVVSDPAGVTWADRTPEGIWYASYAGTGDVIKMKPANDWGKIPSFGGPSLPGTVITFGSLATDYPDFAPFPPVDETDPEKAKENEIILREGTGKTTETKSLLEGEKQFLNMPRLSLWMPVIGYLPVNDDLPPIGAGAFAVLSGYPLQGGAASTTLALGGTAYPTLAQADAFVFSTLPVYTGDLFILALRALAVEEESGDFIEATSGAISYSLPLDSWYFYHDYTDVALIAGLSAVAGRRDETPFASSASIPYRSGLNVKAGIDLAGNRERSDTSVGKRLSANVLVSSFPSLSDDVYLSFEADGSISAGTPEFLAEFSMRTRWFDFPEEAPLPSTLVNLKGKTLSCLYPGRTILSTAMVFPDAMNLRLFAEKLVSSGTNTEGMETPESDMPFNITVDDDWYAGLEMETVSGRSRIAFGLVSRFGEEPFDPESDLRLYCTVKFDAITAIWN